MCKQVSKFIFPSFVWITPKKISFSWQVSWPWHWIQNYLEQRVERLFRFYERHIRKKNKTQATERSCKNNSIQHRWTQSAMTKTRSALASRPLGHVKNVNWVPLSLSFSLQLVTVLTHTAQHICAYRQCYRRTFPKQVKREARVRQKKEEGCNGRRDGTAVCPQVS